MTQKNRLVEPGAPTRTEPQSKPANRFGPFGP